MLTLLWKIGPDQEEIYQVHGVAKIPAARELSDQLDCRGRAHVAFQRLAPDGEDGGVRFLRTVVDVGEVFVMNEHGKTIATYRFEADDRQSIAA